MKINIFKIMIGIIIVTLLVCGLYLYTNITNNRNSIANKRIIIESSFENHAWSNVYQGTIICEDGSIYEFKSENSSNKDLSKQDDDILKMNTTSVGNMEEQDLKKLKKLLEDITSDVTQVSRDVSMDMGYTAIEYWDYSLNKKIFLKGEYAINSSQNIDVILEILDRYGINIKFSNFGEKIN